MATLGELSVRLTAEMAPLTAALRNAESQAQRAGGRVGATFAAGFAQSRAALTSLAIAAASAAFSFGALATAARKSIADLASLDDVANRTGLALKRLQEIGFAVEMSGGELADAVNGLQRLAINAAKAGQGSGDLLKILEANNVALRNQAGQLRPLGDLLDDIADLTKNAANESDQLAIATAAFGRGAATGMVGALATGRSGLREFAEEARKAGVVLDDSVIKKGAELDDQFVTLERRAQALGREIAVAFAGPATDGGKGPLLTYLEAVRDTIEDFRNLNIRDLLIRPEIRELLGKKLGIAPSIDTGPAATSGDLQKRAQELRAQIAALGAPPENTPGVALLENYKRQLAEIETRIAAINAAPVKPVEDFEPKFAGMTAGGPKATAMPSAEATQYEAQVRAIREKTAALKLEVATFGQSVRVQEERRVEAELLNAADEAQIKRTPALLASIKEIAAAYGEQTAALEARKIAQEDAQDALQRDQQLRALQQDASLVGADVKTIEAARFARERLFEVEQKAATNGAAWAAKQKQGLAEMAAPIVDRDFFRHPDLLAAVAIDLNLEALP